MAYTEAKKNCNRKWDKENLDRFSLAAPKGTKERIQEAARDAGESLNEYILRAVMRRMESEET